jgi:signal peptidase I
VIDLAAPEATQLLADLLAADQDVRFAVTGDSMRPFLTGGDIVTLRRAHASDIRLGALLLFRRQGQDGGRLLLHRVVSIQRVRSVPTVIQTQGDALLTPDAHIVLDDVLGRVSLIEGPLPGATPLSLEIPSQRLRALLIAARQRVMWRARQLYAHLRLRLPPALWR